MQKIWIAFLAAVLVTFSVTAADPVLLTEAYVATLGDAAIAKSNAYHEGKYWLALWGTLIDLILLWVLMRYGIVQNIRNWVAAKTKRNWLQTVMFTPIYMVLSTILIFPWIFYTDYMREHQYDLSNHTISSYMSDQMTGLIVGVIGFTILITMLYSIIRRSPDRWWLWGTGLMGAFLAFVMLVSPVVISPLFNEYTPMHDGPLKDRILAMATANGVPVDDVFVVDQSKQTTRISANVQGLGATAQISLNDNLINNNSEAEVAAVMAHEIGHYALGHGQEMLVYFTLIFGIGFAFIHGTFGWVTSGIGSSWGITGIKDIAGLPLLMSILGVYLLLATPFMNSVIRSNEAEADIFGLNVAREPDGFATISLKLSTYRKINPGTWEERIFHDHPSGYHRVLMSMQWKEAMMPNSENVEPAPEG